MKHIIIAGIAIISIFIIILQFIPLGIEPLTEMYFENHTILPVYIFPDKPYNFTFTIHNLEYIDMDYLYNITIQYNSKTEEYDTKSITLKNNESQLFLNIFSLPRNFEKAKISIELIKLTENKMQKDPNLKNITIDLHFWVEEITGPKIIIIPD